MDQETDEGSLVGDDGLAVVLTVVADDLEHHRENARRDVSAARNHEARLDELLDRARALPSDADRPLSRGSVRSTERGTPARDSLVSNTTWTEMRADATRRLIARGGAPQAVEIDDLLDPDEVERIERRFLGGFELRAELDRYDVCAAVTAGLVAALVDFLLVRLPRDTILRTAGLRNEFFDRGSPLTKWLQSEPLPHDNPLSRLCKTPFDRVNLKGSGYDLPGSGGRTHRYHTLGHDPLLGLVFGTIDIMRGGLTGLDRDGRLVAVSGLGDGESNPLTALLVELAHLLSDANTRMGLPPPGWNLTGILQFGEVGPHGLTFAGTARQMYIAGYDSRHFLTMATSPAAAELVLRGYWGLRQVVDGEFEESIVHAGQVARAQRVGDHPRFQGMSLVAHLVASAANAGRIYFSRSPLALNYAQWLYFVRSLLSFSHTKLRSPSEVLAGHAEANLAALAKGWPDAGLTDLAPELVDTAPRGADQGSME